MLKGKNVLEKLQEVANREVKRREQAVKYLEIITESLAEPLDEMLGKNKEYTESDEGTKVIWIPKFNKEEGKYSYGSTDLYFRYGNHYGENDVETPGFYVSNCFPFWGKNLLNIKGGKFWTSVKQICDWIENYLPEYIEKHDKSRDKRLEYLKSIAEYMKNQE